MKKCLIFLISVLMFLFTGCGSSNSEGTAYTEVNTQEGIT
ncbi:MAG TPA: entericidin EcnA/B family protein, partial [Clostridium sp.]|nr:entericidin EcnA/B family protein [Clostridium sp.]